MTNRFLEIERQLRSTPTPRPKKTGRAAPDVQGVHASAPAPKLSKQTAWVRSLRKEAKKAPVVDYTVPGVFDLLQQPSNMTCWATVATMMLEWRRQSTTPIGAMLDSIAQKWGDKFRNNSGLASSEKESFLSDAGFLWEAPMSPTAQGWERMLRDYGPLWVTTDEQPGAGFAIHARIMTGIHGDGTPTGTNVDIIDPATGTRIVERFDALQAKFEEEALTSAGPLRIQIVHFPDNQFGVAQSIAMQRRR